jgi:hypothetical protein
MYLAVALLLAIELAFLVRFVAAIRRSAAGTEAEVRTLGDRLDRIRYGIRNLRRDVIRVRRKVAQHVERHTQEGGE